MKPYEYLKELVEKAKDIEINPNGSAYVRDIEGKGHYLEAQFMNKKGYISPLSTAAKILGYKIDKKLGFHCD